MWFILEKFTFIDITISTNHFARTLHHAFKPSTIILILISPFLNSLTMLYPILFPISIDAHFHISNVQRTIIIIYLLSFHNSWDDSFFRELIWWYSFLETMPGNWLRNFNFFITISFLIFLCCFHYTATVYSLLNAHIKLILVRFI